MYLVLQDRSIAARKCDIVSMTKRKCQSFFFWLIINNNIQLFNILVDFEVLISHQS